jgi:hypothetical protein
MAQPVWNTPAGSLGVIPESRTYRNSVVATDPDGGSVTYRVIAGTLPDGIQFSSAGLLTGYPFPVSENVVSRFTVRATAGTRIADRTFALTVTGNNTPTWVTPAGSIGSVYTASKFDFQFVWDDNDPADTVVVRLASGEIPGGLTLSPDGTLSGWVQPVPNLDAMPGYDITGESDQPYDFVFQSVDKNFEFTLEVTDGKNSSLRTFYLFVYQQPIMSADTTVISDDNTFITSDQTPTIAPFLVNSDPSNLGVYRSDNYYAYRFVGENYSGEAISYAISVSQGYGLPPGLTLDPTSGWYYGYIPDQGATEVTYSFNIVVYQSDYVGTPITCTGTTLGANTITCNDTSQIKTGQPIVFTGTSFGGITAAPTQIYYVNTVVSPTKFTVSQVANSGIPVPLVTAGGSMTAHLIVASEAFPYSLTIIGALDAEVTWLTDSNLGDINNGDTSTLSVAAVNRGGRVLEYRLESGAYNSLPQGLQLLPNGDIAGRVSFDTFSLDLGATTFDQEFAVNRNVTTLDTTFDSVFTFTVNAYAPETTQDIFKVRQITVVDGGTGYNSATPPILQFNDPIGSTALVAEAGTVTIVDGVITAVALTNPGNGYTTDNPAAVTITQGFGGTGAVLSAPMTKTGTRDVVSVFKTFSIRVVRKYNKPYQNLLVRAMPPQNDRDMLAEFLNNTSIFEPDWIYRAEDPNFGVAKNVTYAHAFGLLPEVFETYVESLNLNHYWKTLVLGSIETARAQDANGNVIYEIVYSKIIDSLVNNAGESVNKIVNLPYPITLPDSTVTQQVYPNSLANMREQVIDVVGQISTDVPLPAWMTSTQSNGQQLGFVPAWIIAYTIPGKSNEIAYRISQLFTQSLNQVDFKVDRYILDCELSHNWNAEIQHWGPPTPAEETTFDIYNTDNRTFLSTVSIATDMPFVNINGRTVGDINAMGGLDGIVPDMDGNTLIFVKQEQYDPPLPGNYPEWNIAYAYPINSVTTYGDSYYTALHNVPAGTDITNLYYWKPYDDVDAAWQIQSPFDPLVRTSPEYYPVQSRTPDGVPALWVNDISYQIDGVAYQEQVYQEDNFDVYVGEPDPLDGDAGSFDSLPFSQTSIVPGGDKVECYQTYAGTNRIRCDFTTRMAAGEQIVFTEGVFGGITAGTIYYVLQIFNSTSFSITDTPGGTTPVALTNATGQMIAQAADERMGIWTINIDPVSSIVTLTLTTQTKVNDWVRVTRGNFYRGAQLYYPNAPAAGQTRIAWQPITPVISDQTTFDQNSMQFIAPVDMYDPTESYDKYLVFPKTNILV